jgi:hypothetical protein
LTSFAKSAAALDEAVKTNKGLISAAAAIKYAYDEGGAIRSRSEFKDFSSFEEISELRSGNKPRIKALPPNQLTQLTQLTLNLHSRLLK